MNQKSLDKKKPNSNSSGLINDQPTNTGLKPKKLDWEKEFENQFGIDNELAKEIKSFISSLLDKQKEKLLENILEKNFCDLDVTYDYDGIAQSVIDLHKKL